MHHVSPVPGRFRPLLPAAVLLLAFCLLASGAQALMVPMDDAALATGADEIVRGEIADVHAGWTADHTSIVTTASVRVKGRAKGQGPDTLTLTSLGGTVGDVTQWVEDEPVLVPGHRGLHLRQARREGRPCLRRPAGRRPGRTGPGPRQREGEGRRGVGRRVSSSTSARSPRAECRRTAGLRSPRPVPPLQRSPSSRTSRPRSRRPGRRRRSRSPVRASGRRRRGSRTPTSGSCTRTIDGLDDADLGLGLSGF